MISKGCSRSSAISPFSGSYKLWLPIGVLSVLSRPVEWQLVMIGAWCFSVRDLMRLFISWTLFSSSRRARTSLLQLLSYYVDRVHSGKRRPNVTVWRLSVCPSVCPVGILTVTQHGAPCDAASVHFGGPTTRSTDAML